MNAGGRLSEGDILRQHPAAAAHHTAAVGPSAAGGSDPRVSRAGKSHSGRKVDQMCPATNSRPSANVVPLTPRLISAAAERAAEPESPPAMDSENKPLPDFDLSEAAEERTAGNSELVAAAAVAGGTAGRLLLSAKRRIRAMRAEHPLGLLAIIAGAAFLIGIVARNWRLHSYER